MRFLPSAVFNYKPESPNQEYWNNQALARRLVYIHHKVTLALKLMFLYFRLCVYVCVCVCVFPVIEIDLRPVLCGELIFLVNIMIISTLKLQT